MKALLLGLLVLLGGSLSARDLPTGNAPMIEERLRNARDAIQSRDWARALAELEEAARDEPRSAEVHNLLGYSYRQQSQPNLSRAFLHYRTALRLDPRHRGAHEYIGEAYLTDGKPLEAEKHLLELEKICGHRTCEEYADLARAIADHKARSK